MFKLFKREDFRLVIEDTDFTEIVEYTERYKYPSLEESFIEIIKAYKKRGLNYHRAFGEAMYFNYESEVHRSTIWTHSIKINQILQNDMIKITDMRCIRRWLDHKDKYYSNNNHLDSTAIDED